MKFSQRFEVARPREQVWELLSDVPRVVQCIPGARLLEERSGGAFLGAVEVRLGPVKAAFEGEATHTTDPSGWHGRIEGTGKDRKAGSRARVAIDYTLSATEGGTQVEVDSDITLSGAAAQFGRPGLVRELSARLLQEFGANLEAELSAPGAAPAPPPPDSRKMVGLVLASLWGWIRRGMSRLLGRGDVE